MSKLDMDEELGCFVVTNERRHTLQKFTDLIKDCIHPDHDELELLKWLQASRFRLKAAEKKYRESMVWRKTTGADTILRDFEMPEVIKKYLARGSSGFDKEGRPVMIEPVGKADLKGLILSTRPEDLLKAVVYRMEDTKRLMADAQKKYRKRIVQCVAILDMAGFGPRQFNIPVANFYKKQLQIMQNNYPENLAKAYIINAPKVFGMAFNQLKAFLDPVTVGKFIFLSGSYVDRLLDDIDPSQLPKHYGGTLTDPDGNPHCTTMINYGGKVPKFYFLSKEDYFPEHGTETVTIPKRSTLQVEYNIHHSHTSVVRYIFTSEDSKINFCLYFHKLLPNGTLDTSNQPEILVPLATFDCQNEPEEGLVPCHRPGLYVMMFDNRSNWFSTQKITYFSEIGYIDQETQQLCTTPARKLRQNIAESTGQSNEEKHQPGQVIHL